MRTSSGLKSILATVFSALAIAAGVVGIGLYMSDVPVPAPMASVPPTVATAPGAGGELPPNHPTSGQMQSVAGDLQARLQQESDPQILALKAQLGRNPEDVEALLSIGYLYVEKRDYAKARGYYLRAAKLAPKNPEARTHLGTVAYFLGNVDEALDHYRQVLALNPDYPVVWFEMGAVLRYGKSDLQGAVDAWERFLELDPTAKEADRIRQLVGETRTLMAERASMDVTSDETQATRPEPATLPLEAAS